MYFSLRVSSAYTPRTPFLRYSRRKLLKTLFEEHDRHWRWLGARASRVLFYFHVILRRSTGRYESCLLSFPLVAFTLLLFSLAILFRGYVLLPPLSPCRAPPPKHRHYSSIMLLFFYTVCAIRKAPRLASPISLLYVRRWVYEFYYAVKLLLCLSGTSSLWDANLFHIVVHARGNKASPPSLTSLSCTILFNFHEFCDYH